VVHDLTYEERRARMVERDIRSRGIRDPLVLAAVAQVPRELFVPEKLRQHAYEDAPLPIPGGQTISQPYIVCAMIAALGLRGGERILDIGTGSGYAAAVLSRIAGQVYTVERVPGLARDASHVFREIGYDNISCRLGDGRLGWPEHAPYDAICVAAASDDVPAALLDQLAVGGRMVIPVGGRFTQRLRCIERTSETSFDERELDMVRFVPLI
jgi:protein-L-isoaspartate(D-aspartate) O-methyltransferase